jgi:hypothetical protein
MRFEASSMSTDLRLAYSWQMMSFSITDSLHEFSKPDTE